MSPIIMIINKKTNNISCIALILSLFASATAFSQEGLHVQQLSATDLPTTEALPKGMKMVWNDEFNAHQLDNSKWWDKYFSSLDWVNKEAYEAFKKGEIPSAEIEFTGKSIILKTSKNNNYPYYPGADRKISSIQTYNWETNENMMNNQLGGYFEARIRRDAGKKADRINIAFWFDSPGPDLKYYLEEGTLAYDAVGIRPRGQLFEIDLCEYISTEIVLHGNVDKNGKFERNIGHYIHKGDFTGKWVVHSMLWSPAGLKFYIDGKEICKWWNPNDIKSPNHAMNMFLGAYGVGDVRMEVDYVRHYQWDLEKGNEMPNSGFEYSNQVFPWEGSAKITLDDVHTGTQAAILLPGDSVTQHIYLDHSTDYSLDFWTKSSDDSSSLLAKVENLEAVSGKVVSYSISLYPSNKEYEFKSLHFTSKTEKIDNKATAKITFVNQGEKAILLDDVRVKHIQMK